MTTEVSLQSSVNSEYCIYCKKILPMEGYFDHTTKCEFARSLNFSGSTKPKLECKPSIPEEPILVQSPNEVDLDCTYVPETKVNPRAVRHVFESIGGQDEVEFVGGSPGRVQESVEVSSEGELENESLVIPPPRPPPRKPIKESIPNVPPHPVPNLSPHPIPNVSPHPVPNVSPHSVPNVSPHPVPNVPPHSVPNVSPHGVPNIPPHPIPNVPPHGIPSYQGESFCQQTTTRVYRNPAGEEFVDTRTTYSSRAASEYPLTLITNNLSNPSTQIPDRQPLPYNQPYRQPISCQTRLPLSYTPERPWSNYSRCPPTSDTINRFQRTDSPGYSSNQIQGPNCYPQRPPLSAYEKVYPPNQAPRFTTPLIRQSDTFPDVTSSNANCHFTPANHATRAPQHLGPSMGMQRPQMGQDRFLTPTYCPQYRPEHRGDIFERCPSDYEHNYLSPGLSKTILMENHTDTYPTHFGAGMDFGPTQAPYNTENEGQMHGQRMDTFPCQMERANQTGAYPDRRDMWHDRMDVHPSQTDTPLTQMDMSLNRMNFPQNQSSMSPNRMYMDSNQANPQPRSQSNMFSNPMNISPHNRINVSHHRMDFFHDQSNIRPDGADNYSPHTNTPPNHTNLPPNNIYIPPNNIYIPPNNMHIPPNNMHTTPNNMYIPQNQMNVPQNNMYIPRNQMHIPPDRTNIPPKDMHIPPNQMSILPNEMHMPNQMSISPNLICNRPSQFQSGFRFPNLDQLYPSPPRCENPQLRDRPVTAPQARDPLHSPPPNTSPLHTLGSSPQKSLTPSPHRGSVEGIDQPYSIINLNAPPPFNPDYSISPNPLSHFLPPNPPSYNPIFVSPATEGPPTEECRFNQEVANDPSEELSFLYAACTRSTDSSCDSDSYSDELVACHYCAQEFTTAQIVEHNETCESRLAASSLESETESGPHTFLNSSEYESVPTHFATKPDTLKSISERITIDITSEPESIEAEDQVCRKCHGVFTLSGLKSHAEECRLQHELEEANPFTLPLSTLPTPPLPLLQKPVKLTPRKKKSNRPKPSPRYVMPDLDKETPILPMFQLPTTNPFSSREPPPIPARKTEKMKCNICRKEMAVEEMPSHVEECRNKEEGQCPHCKEAFLITVLPDHTEKCRSGKEEATAIARLVPLQLANRPVILGKEPNPQKYGRCENCNLDVLFSGHRCLDHMCGICYSEVDPSEMEAHRIQCLRKQTSAYSELNRRNWIRCLSCLIDIPPEDHENHVKTCDDKLLGDLTRYKKFTPNLEDIDWATAALTKEQRAAMDHVVKKAKVLSEEATANLQSRVVSLGFTMEELDQTLKWISFEAPIIIHVFLEKIIPLLLNDTHYRNQFETGTSHGSRDLTARKRWEDNIFNNVYRDSKPVDRVKYGVLNIVGDICGVKSCKQYGDSYFILKKVRLRTSFASADSSNSNVKIASCEYYEHVLNEYTKEELSAILSVASKKKPYLNSDVIRQYKEVQIHGPVELSEHVECVVVNKRHKEDTRVKEQLAEFIDKNKCNMIWMD